MSCDSMQRYSLASKFSSEVKNRRKLWDTWVAPSVKRPTSAYDLVVCEFEPRVGSVLTARSPEPASDSMSPSLSALPCSLSFSLSLSQK